MLDRGGGGGGSTRGSESAASRTFVPLCFPNPTRLQVSQEDQKPGFNFQTVPKLNILVRFLAFVLAGGHWVPIKVITGQFS